MKRYILSILLGILGVGGIGIYLFYGTVDHLPNYKLTTIQGNPEEGDNVLLSGYYFGRWRQENLDVTTKGSDYASRNINFRQRFNNYRSRYSGKAELLQQLIKDHRQFMRGKSKLHGIYVDNNWIFYVDSTLNVNDSENWKVTLHISVLDLSSNKSRQWEQTFPTDNNLYISDVQLVGEQIHVLTSQNSKIGNYKKLFNYVVDINSTELLRSDEITPVKDNKEDYVYQLSYLTHDLYSAPSDYAVIHATKQKVISRESNHSYSFEEVGKLYYSYSYKTGELEALPDSFVEINNRGSLDYSLYGDYFSNVTFDSESLTLSRYNLNTRKEEKAYLVTAEQMGATAIKTVRVESNKVYAILQKNDIPMAVVLDIASGEILYAGEVTTDGPVSKLDHGMKQVRLNDLNIKYNE